MKPSEFNIFNGERINNNKIVKLSIIAKPGRGIFCPPPGFIRGEAFITNKNPGGAFAPSLVICADAPAL